MGNGVPLNPGNGYLERPLQVMPDCWGDVECWGRSASRGSPLPPG